MRVEAKHYDVAKEKPPPRCRVDKSAPLPKEVKDVVLSSRGLLPPEGGGSDGWMDLLLLHRLAAFGLRSPHPT